MTHEVLKINLHTKEQLNFIIKAAQHDEVLLSYHYITPREYEERTKLLTDKLPTLSVLIPQENTVLISRFKNQIDEYGDDCYDLTEDAIQNLALEKRRILSDVRNIEIFSNALDTIIQHYIRK